VAITVKDSHGTYTKKRKAEGPALDRRSARYFAVVDNTWSPGFTTRREASAAERDMKGRADKGVKLRAGSTTLAEFLKGAWLGNAEAKFARGQIKSSTVAHYRLMANAYLIPALGDNRLRDLQPADVRKLYADLTARGLASKTVRNVHVALSNALSLAVADGYLSRNVAKARDVAPTARSKEMKVWTPEQVRAFLAHAVDDRLFAAWRLLATCGLRRGEVLALRWQDVGLTAKTVRVERALVVDPDYTASFVTPKSERSRRMIDLDAETVRALRDHRKVQAAEQLAALGAWPDDGDAVGLIFTDEVGRAQRPQTFSRRFKALSKAAGVPTIRLHDLRHTAATLMLLAGVPVHVVSQRLGHSSTSVTMDTYAHVLRFQATGAADALAAVIDG
jgi:integrase